MDELSCILERTVRHLELRVVGQAGEEIKERLGGVMGENAAKSITAGAHKVNIIHLKICLQLG